MTNQPILTRLARLMHRLRLRSPATEAEKREWAAIRQAASVAGSAHTLRIISLDDAQAECLAGDWHLSVTGPQTRGQIETEFAQHRPADHSVPVATDRCELRR